MNRLGLFTLSLLLATACREPAHVPSSGGPRVVSLAPSLTEIVFAIGAGSNLVGRSSACDFPKEARAVPVIGDFGVPSMECLAAAAPTLVLELALADDAVGARMDRLGLNRRRIPCDRLADIPPAIREVGRFLDRADRANALAATINDQIAKIRAELPPETNRPTVFVEVWHDPITTAGRESFVADLIELAGGRNIGSEVAAPYYTVSSEWIIARNPDIVLALYMTPGTNVPSVTVRSGWSGIAAVRKGRVYGGLNNDVVLRPGPRVMEGVSLLRQCLQPVKNH
jgi:iron complex transport system substrate-binding protein